MNEIARARGQSLAQMALAWVLRLPEVTSALVGASRVEQVEQNVAALDNLNFSPEELRRIDDLVGACLIKKMLDTGGCFPDNMGGSS